MKLCGIHGVEQPWKSGSSEPRCVGQNFWALAPVTSGPKGHLPLPADAAMNGRSSTVIHIGAILSSNDIAGEDARAT